MKTAAPPRYAGFWRRLAASLIDTVLVALIILPLLFTLYGPAYFQWLREEAGIVSFYGIGDLLIGKLLPLFLAVGFWTRGGGATPGKRLLGCRVADRESGRPPTLRQAVGRYFGYLLSALPLYLGFLWVAWDKNKQGFHDKLARTVVLYAPDDEAEKGLEELVREAA